MEFLFSCSTQYLTRSLRLLELNIRTEIPYLRTPMFYSLRFEIVRIVDQVKRKFVAIKQLNLSVHGKVGEARIVFVDYIYRI